MPDVYIIHSTPSGTTSACAENAEGFPAPTTLMGNYLRVRGECDYGGKVGAVF